MTAMKFGLKNIDGNDEEEIKLLSRVASEIVKQHYDPIIGAEQNDYMIEKFQSPQSIAEQIEHGYKYYLAEADGKPVGFTGFYQTDYGIYLSKFYINKNFRGNGIGRKILDFLIEETQKYGKDRIRLNVNKHNSDSIEIYKHFGFEIVDKEKNDIGHGFYMDDYVMEYKI